MKTFFEGQNSAGSLLRVGPCK